MLIIFFEDFDGDMLAQIQMDCEKVMVRVVLWTYVSADVSCV